MNDPLQHLKSMSAPQRSGFREQLEQRVHTAIASQSTPMSQRYSFLKYLLAAPLLATAVYGAVFFINRNSNQPTRWTAQAVQAAVIKSIAETFADIQDDTVHYQRFNRQQPGSIGFNYTDERWQSGLNSMFITTDHIAQRVNFSTVNQALTADSGHGCAYDPEGVRADGPSAPGGTVNFGQFYCTDGSATESIFPNVTGTDVKPTSSIVKESELDQWLVIQWNTNQALTNPRITAEVMVTTNSETEPYRYNGLITDNGSTDSKAFVNKATADGYLQSIVVPDIAYLAKYEPTVIPEMIYFQLSYDSTVSTVYQYDVASQQLSIPQTAVVTDLVTAYQTHYLEQQTVDPYNIITDSKNRLTRVQANGSLQDYTTDATTAELHASYVIAEDIDASDGWRVAAGTYTFVIDINTNQIKQWSLTDSYHNTETTKIEEDTTLTDDSTTFFTEEHWRVLLKERGVK